jgi:oligosaccharide repeat unit polymerase
LTPDRVVAACVAGVLLSIAAIVFHRRGTPDISRHSTITLFAFVWGVSLGFYALPWIRFSRPSDLAWATIYGSVATFLIACVLVERFAQTSSRPSTRTERLDPARLHVAIVITAVLGYVGFAFFVRAVNRTVGWTTLFTDLEAARHAQEGSRFGQEYGNVKLLTYFSGISLLLWTVALREHAFTGRWRLLAPIGLFVLAPYFFLGERLSLITVFMWTAAFHLLWRPIRSPRRVAVLALSATVAAAGFFLIIGHNKGATIHNYPVLKQELTTQRFDQFAFPYLYLTANFPVFSKLTQDPIAPRTYGSLTFWPAAKLSNVALRRTHYPPKFGAFYDIPFDLYNSATWLGPFYLDFGVPGSLLFPALFGLATTWLLILARQRRTLPPVWLAALGLMIIAFSPLKSAFSDASTWEFIIMAPVVGFFTAGRPRTESNQPDSTHRKSLIRRHPVLFVLLLLVLGGVAAAAVGLRYWSSPAHTDESSGAVSERLSLAGEKLVRIYDQEGASTPHVLATRLSVSDPSENYIGYYSYPAVPPVGAIGVFAKQHEFRLRAKTSSGDVFEAIGVPRGGRYRLVGPTIFREGLITNGGFESTFGLPWVIASQERVTSRITTNALDGAYSLSLRYRRPAGGSPTSLTQLVRNVPTRAAGTRYTFRQDVLTRHLSRQVTCGFQFIYTDGTSQYVPGTVGPRPPRTTAAATGILAGSRPAGEITASGVARRRVAAIRVLSVDTGTEPLQGVIVVDDVRLAPQ